MAIAGGVLLSTLISFYLVPPAFLLISQRSKGRSATTSAEPRSELQSAL